MSTITLADAQAHLAEVIAGLPAGAEVVITDGTRPVATLTAVPPPALGPQTHGSAVGISTIPDQTPPGPVFGRGKGMLTIHSDDDDHLLDFAEYM